MAAKYADKPPPKYQEDTRFRKRNKNVDSRKTFESRHGAELTADEIEFANAMERYKRTNNRPWPHFAEVLRVLKTLGYRKQEN